MSKWRAEPEYRPGIRVAGVTPIYDALVNGITEDVDDEVLALAAELHGVSHHGQDGDEFGSALCQCIRQAYRVLDSQWLQTRIARVATGLYEGADE